MSTSRPPTRDGQCRLAPAALHGLRRLARWIVVAAAVITLVTFASVGTSQACPGSNTRPAQLAAKIDNAPSMTAQKATYKSAQSSAAAPWAAGFAKKPCCGDSTGHCHCPAGAGACCPACTAGAIVAGWSVTRDPAPHVVVAPLQVCLLSFQSDGQFRQPRDTL